MKKHANIFILVVGLFMASFSTAQVQFPIPSYLVELTQVNTIFEENEDVVLIAPLSMEEKKINVHIGDLDPSQTSWVTILIYSLDGQDVLGPYTVMEGSPLEITIDDREWGVKVMNYLDGAVLSVWIE